LIVRFSFLESPISLFDEWRDYSFVPTVLSEAAAPSDRRGRSEGPRECAPSLTAAITVARCGSAWMVLAVVGAATIATCVVDREARSEPLSETSPAVSNHVDGFIAEASERFGIPAAWIHAIIRVEGGGDARIAPRRGAIGLMQLMPETWAELRIRYALDDDPSEPRDNILAGAAHIREMYDRYGSKGLLAAYNVGPTRYDEHVKTGAPLPAETQAYVTVLAPLIEPGRKDVLKSTAGANVVSWRKAPLSVAPPERSSSDKPLAPNVLAGRSSKFQSSADWSALAPRSVGLFVRRGMEAGSQ
jgi:hypothetical protein